MPHDLDRPYIPGNKEVENVFSGLPRGKDPTTGQTTYFLAGVTSRYNKDGNLEHATRHSGWSSSSMACCATFA